MFTISPPAAEAIHTMTLRDPAASGIRVATRPEPTDDGDSPSIALLIELASKPEASDEILVDKGVPVFIDPAIARYLDDKQLEVDEAARFRLSSRHC